MGFSRQEYWSGLPLPSPEVLNSGDGVVREILSSWLPNPSTGRSWRHLLRMQMLKAVFGGSVGLDLVTGRGSN